MVLLNSNRKNLGKVGLALGSGSARGWSHIGVIRALNEMGIHIDYIAGTSIGALVGAIYAANQIDAFEKIVLQLDWKQIIYFFDVVFPKSGLIDGKKVSAFVRKHVKGMRIEELFLPFRAIASDLNTGKEVVISDGDVIEAIRASISVPGIFTPVKRGGSILIDGGLVNPVPVNAVREMGADFVIAVDLNHDIVNGRGLHSSSFYNSRNREGTDKTNAISKALNDMASIASKVGIPYLAQIQSWIDKKPEPTIFEVLLKSIAIMERQITVTNLRNDPPDLLIQPRLGHIRLLEFNRAKEVIEEGYNEAIVATKKLC
ncbi:MAG: patatin-like phospholipase family protein [Gammaproteobacteria bacterium]|nr:patatin-like phospholipase family protein [Gammaproteobacteria bacterium]